MQNDVCQVITFPTPSSYFEQLFYPTLAPVHPSFTFKTLASFSARDIITYTGISISAFVSQAIDNNFAIMSKFDHASALLIFSLAYRIGQLVAIAIQHRIEQGEGSKYNKLLASGGVILLPLAIIYLVGGSPSEMIFASLVKIAASYVLPPLYSNPIKELDLISTTRHFHLKNFLGKNMLMAARNLFTSAIVIDCAIGILVHGENFLRIILLDQGAKTLMFETCFDQQGKLTMVAGFGRATTTLTYFVDECAWMVGKILVDGVFILLKYAGSVEDLRDPLRNKVKNLFPSFNRRKFLQAHILQNAPAPLGNAHATQKKHTKTALMRQSAKNTSTSGLIEQSSVSKSTENKVSIPLRAKVKTRGSAQAQPVHTQEKVILPLTINIPNYQREVVALQGQGIEKMPNVWGVMSYGIRNKEKHEVGPYMDSLRTGHVGSAGSQGSIKYLGKNKKTNQIIYELRPAQCEKRMLGTLVRGEEAVYDALKSAFGYERALELTDQMRQADQEMTLIDFQIMVTHKQISEFLM
jgi:hypothetical protein